MHGRFPFSRRAIAGLGTALILAMSAGAVSTGAMAQAWTWPWEAPQRPAPAPVYRPPAPVPAPGGATSGNRPPICLQLEQRLAQDANRGSTSREAIPRLEQEIRQLERQIQPAAQRLEANCFEAFFFSKQLRQTRECVALNQQVDQGRRRIAELDTQRQSLMSSSGRSYQDDIIRELARNNCGANYNQEAARRGGGGLFGWLDEDGAGSGGGGLTSNGAPIGTYRTVCVRLCDGYFFPVSYSTLPAHFDRDEELCKSHCAAPAELYYYQNPGGTPDQMIAHRTRERIAALKTAFRFRKEYVQGCSCKTAEYVPSAVTPDRRPEPAASGSSPGRPARQGALPQ